MGFGAIAEAVAGLATGIGQAAINYKQAERQEYWNRENFDYQKALQQQIFEREDNAVQRRMADLKAAGLNPNLAAGSAANAGSVVGRANTSVKDINIGNPVGTALDMASHVAQLRAQNEQNKILGNERRESEANAQMAENAVMLDNLELYNMLGLNTHIIWNSRKNQFEVGFEGSLKPGEFSLNSNGTYQKDLDAANSRLMQYLDWQYQNNKNSADLLQKDVNWYTADKVGSYLGTIGNLFGAGASGYGNIMRGKYGYRR